MTQNSQLEIKVLVNDVYRSNATQNSEVEIKVLVNDVYRLSTDKWTCSVNQLSACNFTLEINDLAIDNTHLAVTPVS
jgi:hypothetical protein